MITREELDPVKDYVERTWIGTPTQPATFGSGRTVRGKKPVFSVELSNQYQATIEGRPRHNDHMESNNNKLQQLIKPKPSAWDLLSSLRDAYRGDFQLLFNVRIWLISLITH